MRISHYILSLIATAEIASCGGGQSKENTAADGSKESDTLELPAETIKQITYEPTAAKKHAHETANFFAIEADGKVMIGNSADILQTTLIHGTDITLAPDGDIIAYTDTTGERSLVHLYDIKSQKDTTLDLGDYNYRARSFSPDGNYLAVSCQFDEFSCMVMLYGMYDSSITPIYNPDTKALFNPIFSPDGKMLSCHDMQKVLIYTIKDGEAKHTKTISCDNLCIDNDLSINPICKIQLTRDHKKIVYTCADYGTERENFRHLNIYDIKNGEILKILPADKSCQDFEVSEDDNIYFLMEEDSTHSVACLASLEDLSPVIISKENFANATALRVAF